MVYSIVSYICYYFFYPIFFFTYFFTPFVTSVALVPYVQEAGMEGCICITLSLKIKKCSPRHDDKFTTLHQLSLFKLCHVRN